MSRIGKLPIDIPQGVKVDIKGNDITVTGKLGTLSRTLNPEISVRIEDNKLLVERKDDERQSRALHGLCRMLVSNMVEGVSKGFTRKLIVNGVGYKMTMKGKDIELNIGYSHPILHKCPEGITLSCISADQLAKTGEKSKGGGEITVAGIDKEQVGQCAANIRAYKKADPYFLYGIRYSDEVIIRKEGKKAGK